MSATSDDQTYENADPKFYEDRDRITRQAAKTIIPLVLELVPAQSVIDLGCGVGTWLSVYQQLGVQQVYGVESMEVKKQLLQIPEDCFEHKDLTQPYRIDRRFDLAMTLEVAEHLPETSASGFVDSLVHLAPVVLFSAAIPHQGGVHHVNEQWPQYWVDLFAQHDYVVIDAIRRRIWHEQHIKGWYRQNILLFAQRDRLGDYPALQSASQRANGQPLDIIHPQIYQWKVDDFKQAIKQAQQWTLGDVARRLPGLIRQSLKSRFG